MATKTLTLTFAINPTFYEMIQTLQDENKDNVSALDQIQDLVNLVEIAKFTKEFKRVLKGK